MNRAFSLVELSIVLVILGLLTGGILAGQSLIRAAELRSITSDVNRYTSAMNTFRDKYFALPGDMANATKVWGPDSVSCPNGGGSSGVCDGNGNGWIGGNGTPSIGNGCEQQEAWRHLARAGLIEGSYTPNTAPACVAVTTIGTNEPKLRINGAITISPIGTFAAGTFPDTYVYPGSHGHVFVLGNNTTVTSATPLGDILKPEEAWNIDTKMDDGRPAYGSVTTRPPRTGFFDNPCSTNDAASSAEYNVGVSVVGCALYVKTGF